MTLTKPNQDLTYQLIKNLYSPQQTFTTQEVWDKVEFITTKQLNKDWGNKPENNFRGQLNSLTNKGLLFRHKRGVYSLSPKPTKLTREEKRQLTEGLEEWVMKKDWEGITEECFYDPFWSPKLHKLLNDPNFKCPRGLKLQEVKVRFSYE